MRASRKRTIGIGIVLACAFALAAGAGEEVAVDDQYHAVTTLRDLNSLGVALEAYYRDHGAYPKVATTEELRKLLEPRYAAHLESRDAWGTELRYVPAADAQDYRLASAGSDRRFDEPSWETPVVSIDSRTDAVFSGHFLRKWAIAFP